TCLFFCVFYDTAHPEFYTLSLHDALPILVAARIETEIAAQRAHVAEQGSGDELGGARDSVVVLSDGWVRTELREADAGPDHASRSEEHTSELQSRGHLVCRLLLEKKTSST